MKPSNTILFLCLLIYVCCTASPVAEKNAENIKKIQIGMRIESVKEIMGEPEEIIILPYNDKEYEFLYLSPTGYSDYFRVFISRNDSIVLRIGDGL